MHTGVCTVCTYTYLSIDADELAKKSMRIHARRLVVSDHYHIAPH